MQNYVNVTVMGYGFTPNSATVAADGGTIPLGTSLMCFRFLQVTWSFLKTGELPHHDHGHVDGLEDEKPPVNVNLYGMDDNLHMHDLKHPMVGERQNDKKGSDQS